MVIYRNSRYALTFESARMAEEGLPWRKIGQFTHENLEKMSPSKLLSKNEFLEKKSRPGASNVDTFRKLIF